MEAFLRDNYTHILDIIREAGDAILDIYADYEEIEVSYKKDHTPLTQADQAAHTIIHRGLSLLTPKIPIISEEAPLQDYEDRKDAPYIWMIDPLDGTKEFIKKRDQFTVNIALIHRCRSIAGFVSAPALGGLYYAWKGWGAYAITEGKEIPISCSSYRSSDAGLRIVCSVSHMDSDTEDYISNFINPATLAVGSSLKFLYIATGQADLYPRLAPTSEWDTAAAQIILEEAGGSVIDRSTGQAMQYNKESILNPHFIAKGKEIDA